MDLHAVASGYSPSRALDLEHPVLARNAVLCAKLLAGLWLATGQVVYLRADPLPFFGASLPLARSPYWPQALILLQLCAILTIVCSRFVRTGCALLAGIIALLCALDQPLFSNNRAFCAALLGMLALGDITLCRLQVALVYGCAGLDKLLDPAWRAGVFLRTFSASSCRIGELWSPGWSVGAPLPFTCALSARLTTHAELAVALSALVIGTELLLALGYARGVRASAPLAVCFHCLLFVATGSTFGMFFYAGLAAALLLLDLDRMPTPFDRAWLYVAACGALAGPWVRPGFAAVLACVALAATAYVWRTQRT